MRILVLTHYFPAHGGGIERVANELATRLATRGFTIEWMASAEPHLRGDLPPGAEAAPAWNVLERMLGFPYPIWSPAALAPLWRAVQRCDALHLHDSLYMGNALAYAIARILKRPILLTQHVGLVPYRNRLIRGAMELANNLVASNVIRGATLTVFCSRTTERYFAARTGATHPHMFIANGVDTDTFRPACPSRRLQLRDELSWPASQTVLLFVGRFVEKKGLAILRRLVARFRDELWVFVGSGPDDPSDWKATNVVSLGQRSQAELVSIYQAADLLVLPSVGEGFPLVVQESMACGTPVAISDETAAAYLGLKDMVWQAEPSEQAFEELLRRIVSDRAAMATKRDDAATFAHREWGWDRCADQYAAIFERLAGSTRGESA